MAQSVLARVTPTVLAIDVEALQILDAALIEEQWFGNFEIPPDSLGIRRVQIADVVYILSRSATDLLKLLVVNVSASGVFRPGDNKRSIFERILRVALRHFDRSVTIPTAWQVYHEGSKLSVYAANLYRSTLKRLYFEQSPDGDDNIYAYAQTDRPEDLERVPADMRFYKKVMDNYLEAAASEEEPVAEVGRFGILLSEPLGRKLSTPGTLSDWYDRLLSTAQRDFVRRDHSNPVRLRGAAGTGKTQSMVVKTLWDLYHRSSSDQTIAFLTHSSALAHDVVRGMLHTLDPTEKWATLTTPDGQNRLWVGTLYELAQERLGYADKGLRPLSIDGRDGREWQRVLINDAIDAAVADPVVAIEAREKCPNFLARLKDREGRAALVEDIMNEFACVLDAENIRKGTPESERYITAAREAWQMPLASAAEAAVLLTIHEAYRAALRAENYLSMDQMIADYSRYLTTHETPECLEYAADVDLIDGVLAKAAEDAREIDGGGRQVAVLCANENLFDRYRNSPRVQEKCVSMTSREDLRQLSYAKRKVVFSMPEYVAGLQFSVVYLIHVDEVDLSDDNISAGGRRRYVSRVYLGASRASHRLVLACSKSRGGMSTLLSGPLADGTLRKAST